MITDRLVCGFATVFGQRSYDGRSWSVGEFSSWLRLEMAQPLRLDHGPIFDHHGAIASVGAARRFAVVRTPVQGLLTLAELDPGRWADSLLSRNLR